MVDNEIRAKAKKAMLDKNDYRLGLQKIRAPYSL